MISEGTRTMSPEEGATEYVRGPTAADRDSLTPIWVQTKCIGTSGMEGDKSSLSQRFEDSKSQGNDGQTRGVQISFERSDSDDAPEVKGEPWEETCNTFCVKLANNMLDFLRNMPRSRRGEMEELKSHVRC